MMILLFNSTYYSESVDYARAHLLWQDLILNFWVSTKMSCSTRCPTPNKVVEKELLILFLSSQPLHQLPSFRTVSRRPHRGPFPRLATPPRKFLLFCRYVCTPPMLLLPPYSLSFPISLLLCPCSLRCLLSFHSVFLSSFFQ